MPSLGIFERSGYQKEWKQCDKSDRFNREGKHFSNAFTQQNIVKQQIMTFRFLRVTVQDRVGKSSFQERQRSPTSAFSVQLNCFHC